VLGGERRAVRPDDVVAQFPGDAHAVLGDAAVLETGELGSEGEDGFASSVEVDQRLEDQAGSAGVLVTLREVRVEDGRRLPVEDTHEVAAAAAHAPALGAAGLFLGGLFLLFLGLLGWFGFGVLVLRLSRLFLLFGGFCWRGLLVAPAALRFSRFAGVRVAVVVVIVIAAGRQQ